MITLNHKNPFANRIKGAKHSINHARRAEYRLMKKTIVEIVNNQVQLHFHPKLSDPKVKPTLTMELDFIPLEHNVNMEAYIPKHVKYAFDFSDKLAAINEGKVDIDLLIKHKLRLLMLFDMASKLRIESEQQHMPFTLTANGDYSFASSIIIENMLQVNLRLHLFTDT